MPKSIVYGLGGFDASKPHNNVIEIIDIPDLEESVEPDATE